MGLFSNPLGYAGYPPGVQAPATVVNSTVRAATATEVAAGVLTNAYVSPATAASLDAGIFASPPVLGSVTPNNVNSLTLTISDAHNVVVGSTTGTKIGTATSQKIGFFNATPIIQPAAASDILASLIALGLIASGASPLNLGSAALGSGTITIADAGNIVVGSTTGTKIGTATSQKIGFYNATPVVQQSQGAITNSVTSGGTTGTIANFTDLTVYANDAAAIRNDIYQLALGLSGVVTALRNLGICA